MEEVLRVLESNARERGRTDALGPLVAVSREAHMHALRSRKRMTWRVAQVSGRRPLAVRDDGSIIVADGRTLFAVTGGAEMQISPPLERVSDNPNVSPDAEAPLAVTCLGDEVWVATTGRVHGRHQALLLRATPHAWLFLAATDVRTDGVLAQGCESLPPAPLVVGDVCSGARGRATVLLVNKYGFVVLRREGALLRVAVDGIRFSSDHEGERRGPGSTEETVWGRNSDGQLHLSLSAVVMGSGDETQFRVRKMQDGHPSATVCEPHHRLIVLDPYWCEEGEERYAWTNEANYESFIPWEFRTGAGAEEEDWLKDDVRDMVPRSLGVQDALPEFYGSHTELCDMLSIEGEGSHMEGVLGLNVHVAAQRFRDCEEFVFFNTELCVEKDSMLRCTDLGRPLWVRVVRTQSSRLALLCTEAGLFTVSLVQTDGTKAPVASLVEGTAGRRLCPPTAISANGRFVVCRVIPVPGGAGAEEEQGAKEESDGSEKEGAEEDQDSEEGEEAGGQSDASEQDAGAEEEPDSEEEEEEAEGIDAWVVIRIG